MRETEIIGPLPGNPKMSATAPQMPSSANMVRDTTYNINMKIFKDGLETGGVLMAGVTLLLSGDIIFKITGGTFILISLARCVVFYRENEQRALATAGDAT